jgi:hypothetical protein
MDPFSEQKLLFDLETSRSFSTSAPITTEMPTEEEMDTTISPDYDQDKYLILDTVDTVDLDDNQVEMTTMMTTPMMPSTSTSTTSTSTTSPSTSTTSTSTGTTLIPEKIGQEPEVSTYYPLKDEVLETSNQVKKAKPRYFQAYELVDIVEKIASNAENGGKDDSSHNEEEPSNAIANCISEFLGCIEKRNIISDENNDEKEEALPSKARNCYQLFQDCSGSVILIPDLYQNTVEEQERSS